MDATRIADPLQYLFGLEQFGIKFGLGNIHAIVAALGHPERAFPSVHVAGTNGKGSVTAMVDAALRAAGHRTGRYTSPHLVALNERFAIDGQPVDDPTLLAVAGDVRDVIEALRARGTLDVQPTFFEATTAIAFELFRRAKVDIAVVEVGLGGRLDSTNVITPMVSAITSIALDHEQYLGPTLREIAKEKAGIIKPDVPVVVGEVDGEAFATIAAVAIDRGGELIRAAAGVEVTEQSREPSFAHATSIHLKTPVRDYGAVRIGLPGMHQVVNAIVAVRILETLDKKGISAPAEAIVSGLANVSWPGRLEHRRVSDDREMILDAAHNPAGAAALAAYLADLGGAKPPLVFAAMRDKDAAAMFRALLPVVSRLIVTRASNRRSADPEVLARQARAILPAAPVQVAETPQEALSSAWAHSPRVVVAGSIFLLGDVMKEFPGS